MATRAKTRCRVSQAGNKTGQPDAQHRGPQIRSHVIARQEGPTLKRRNNRQDAIREIVRNKSIKTQRALVEELEGQGFTCTQATISRDIADMGLRKLPEGVYVLAEDLHLQRMVSDLVVNVIRAKNIVMVHSQPGTAQGVAAAIDAASLPDVAGSIAGDDTIMVVCTTDEDAQSLEELVNKLRNVRK